MKICELMVLGDDGGLHGRIDAAIKNMTHHAKTHKDKKIRGLCKEAIKRLDFHSNHPQSLYDDPHSFLRILSNFDGEPDASNLQGAVDTLGSYAQSDSD